MLLLALLYGVGSGVVTLIARSTARRPTPPLPAAHVKGATVSGRGAATSSSFALEGDYLVRWTATPSTANGCYHAAVLERADDGREVDLLVNEAISGSAAQTGTVPVAGLARAATLRRSTASSACAWRSAFEVESSGSAAAGSGAAGLAVAAAGRSPSLLRRRAGAGVGVAGGPLVARPDERLESVKRRLSTPRS